MARMKVDGFDEIDKMFRELGKAEEFAVEAVNEAAPILERTTQNAVEEAANKGYASGELAKSFKRTPAKRNELGVYSVVRPVGERDGHDNAERAGWLEFGVYHRNLKWGQEPSPFRQKAINDAKAECETIIERKIHKAVDKAVGK